MLFIVTLKYWWEYHDDNGDAANSIFLSSNQQVHQITIMRVWKERVACMKGSCQKPEVQ